VTVRLNCLPHTAYCLLPGIERWKYEHRFDGFATSARSSAARASCGWSARTRSTSSGRD